MAKIIFDNYGVKMNGSQTSRFNSYVNNLKFGMNTITKNERFEVANNWLKNN
jgi:tetrahydromethanopterin S-methyltransferase subunit F